MTKEDFFKTFTVGRRQAWRAITICLTYDIIAAIISMVLAIKLRYMIDWVAAPTDLVILYSVELAIATVIAVIATGTFRQVWRHTNASDLRRVVQAALLANLIFLPMMFFSNRLEGFFRSSILIELPILIFLMVLGRLVSRARATGQFLAAFRTPDENKPPAILVGKAHKLASVIRDLNSTEDGLPIQPLAIIETTGTHEGLAIGGVQVFGDLSQLEETMSVMTERYEKAPWIALVGSTTDRKTMQTILDVAAQYNATIQRLKPGGDVSHEGISPADLLTRSEKKLDPSLVCEMVSGAKVFVTGAGGTIGSELVKQCAAFGPTEITLYDSAEYNLYEIDMFMASTFPNVSRRAILGDVRDKARLREVMSAAQPDIVLHAAALKHVPLMETNPNEAILTNIEGARNAALVATECNVKNFVFISTDKAVQPSNVMGASKRTAELYIQALAPTQTQTKFAIVRFGNVLGSAGSVAPLFERQIEQGGPVTVTDAEMTRYFMSVEEASSLVLQSAALSARTEHSEATLYVLEMGQPVSIVELAERMIRLKGLRPGEDIPIVFSGLRPGEKLSEKIFYPKEDVSNTEVDGVLVARADYPALTVLNPKIDTLINAAKKRDRSISLSLMSELAPELQLGNGSASARTIQTLSPTNNVIPLSKPRHSR